MTSPRLESEMHLTSVEDFNIPSVPGAFPSNDSAAGDEIALGTLGTFADSAVSAIAYPFGVVKSKRDRRMVAVQKATARREKVINDAASALFEFNTVHKQPLFPERAANEQWNQFSLQALSDQASGALSRVRKSGWFIEDWEVCKTLEDPDGDFNLPPGTGKATIKALTQCQNDGGLTYKTFVSVKKYEENEE